MLLDFTDEDAQALGIIAGIAITSYSQAMLDGRMSTETAKIATRETLKDLYPHASTGDITIATANAMACFIAWQQYLEVKSRGVLQ